MDNKGRVTVVLHWDQRNQNYRASSSGGMDASPSKKTTHQQNGFGVGGLLMENNGQLKRDSEQLYQHHQSIPTIYRHGSTPQITVIHHDAISTQTDRLGKYFSIIFRHFKT